MSNNQLGQTLQLVRAALLADAALVALVGNKVRGAHAREADLGTLQFPFVVVETNGGSGSYSGHLHRVDLYLWAYGASSGEAVDVYDAAYVALHAARLSTTNVGEAGYARETARPIVGYNDAFGGYFARGTWSAYTAG